MSWLTEALKKPSAGGETPAGGSSFKNFFQAGIGGFKQAVLDFATTTPSGQAVRNEAIKAYLRQIAINPVTWLAVGAVVLYLIIWRR